MVVFMGALLHTVHLSNVCGCPHGDDAARISPYASGAYPITPRRRLRARRDEPPHNVVEEFA
jgi:hypothetical protein